MVNDANVSQRIILSTAKLKRYMLIPVKNCTNGAIFTIETIEVQVAEMKKADDDNSHLNTGANGLESSID